MHEASEMDDLYVGHCLWCGKPYLPAKGKKYIQRFCSVQCRNSYYRNEDKDALTPTIGSCGTPSAVRRRPSSTSPLNCGRPTVKTPC